MEQSLEITEVVEARIRQPLGLQRRRIPHHAALREGLSIHHGHHAADAGAGADLGPLKGLHQGHRQGQTAGFDHDAIEVIGPLQQHLHGGQEFILDGAAQASVGQLHHRGRLVDLGVVRTHPAAADQVAIDAHLTELVDEHSEAQAAGEQQLAQQGGFASTEEAGHHGDR